MKAILAASLATLAGLALAPAKADFLFDQMLPASQSLRLDRYDAQTARAAAKPYFDEDAFVALGVLALAGGALAGTLVAVARRREEKEERREPAWRSAAREGLEANLTAFAPKRRRAA